MGLLGRALEAFRSYAASVMVGPTLLYEVTARCNLDCRYCYNVWKGSAPYPEGELGPAAAKELLLRAAAQSGARHVTFTGGEPLLREDLEDLAAALRAHGVASAVISNGTLLDDRRARSLAAAGVGLFELPLLAADRAVHDGLVRAPAFDAVLEAVASLRAARARVVLAFVATRRNLAAWPEVLELALALGVDGVMFNRFNPGGEGARNRDELLVASPDELGAALRAADEAVARHGLPVSIAVPIPPCVVAPEAYPHLTFVGCQAGTANAYWTIDPAGRLRPCNHSPTILGDLRTESFAEVRAKPTTAAWLAALPVACRECRHAASCRGCCKAAAEACHGSPTAEDPFVRAVRAGR